AVSKETFTKDPVNFIKLFVLADEHQASFSPEVLRDVRANVRLIDDKLRNEVAANRLFMRLLMDSRDPEGVLRKMNEAGVLGRFIPDFGRIVSMMQFNMYHHFTVDEHLIRTIGFLSRIARELGPRLGLSASETETAAWLVEHHLAMSQFAQSRDLNDAKTLRDFAA